MSIGYGCPRDGDDPNCQCDHCQGVDWHIGETLVSGEWVPNPNFPKMTPENVAKEQAFVNAMLTQIERTIWCGRGA